MVKYSLAGSLMDIRLGVLITAVWFAVSSGPARAELQPKDPDHAPIAVVDRFSDSAGTLLRRSADNHLPGPNEPIDSTLPLLMSGAFRLLVSRRSTIIWM